MRVKYGLIRWAGFLEHKDILSEQSRKKAGQFFRGVQRLEQDEIKLLHEKYVTGDWVTFDSDLCVLFNNRPLTDSAIAEKRGVALKDYRLKRQEIEKKLQRFIGEEHSKSDEKEKQELEKFHLVVGRNLYLKCYEVSKHFLDEVKIIEVTPSKQEAKACSIVDENKLKRYGFEREKIQLWHSLI